MESILTIMGMLIRIQLADETEASSAEEQLARDSQLKVTNCRWDGSYASAVPLYQNRGQFGAFLCLIKPYFFPCRRQGKSNNKNWICPFHAEPVQSGCKSENLKMNAIKEEDIVAGLKRLGISAGDVILVHSSLKSFGYVDGGADAVIDALIESVNPDGTVIVPTITGLEQHSEANPPIFDVRNSPSWTGKIPETFRKRDDAIRSLHPTHSVAAIGKYAEYVTREHIDSSTPCGEKSPYMKLVELDGKVVFIGVTLKSCTLLHSVEELAKCPYHLQPNSVTAKIIDADGNIIEKTLYIHKWGTQRDFEKLEPIFLNAGIMKIGKVGNAEIRILQAKPAVELTLNLLKKNPYVLCRN